MTRFHLLHPSRQIHAQVAQGSTSWRRARMRPRWTPRALAPRRHASRMSPGLDSVATRQLPAVCSRSSGHRHHEWRKRFEHHSASFKQHLRAPDEGVHVGPAPRFQLRKHLPFSDAFASHDHLKGTQPRLRDVLPWAEALSVPPPPSACTSRLRIADDLGEREPGHIGRLRSVEVRKVLLWLVLRVEGAPSTVLDLDLIRPKRSAEG